MKKTLLALSAALLLSSCALLCPSEPLVVTDVSVSVFSGYAYRYDASGSNGGHLSFVSNLKFNVGDTLKFKDK